VSGWVDCELGQVATLQRGFDLPHRLRAEGATPIVTSSGIGGKHNVYQVAGPGVVTGRYGTIGEVFYIEEDFWPLNTTLFVKNFHGNDARFVAYLLKTIDFDTHSGKSGVPGVNRNDLHTLSVSIPKSKKEQKAIAKALSDTDALIAALEKLITKKRAIKTATMQQLLTGKTRLPGFGEGKGYKDSELGRIPEDWEVIDLAELTSGISSGTSRKTLDGVAQSVKLYGSTGAIGRCATADYNGPMVLVARVGANAGFVYKVDGSYGVSDNTLMVKLKDPADFDYVYRVLKSKDLNDMVFGSGQPLITGRLLKRLKIVTPSQSNEKNSIATVLDAADDEITALEAKLQKNQAIKTAMMQQLLTGRTRLI